MKSNRVMSSDYMHWAKTHFNARYNLANSGVMDYPTSRLPIRMKDIKLSGKNYYGYEPLLQAIAKKSDVTTDRVFSTLGTSLANHIAMAVMFEQGDEILIEHPTYELLISTAQYIGYKVNRFKRRFENGFQIDPDDVRKSISSKTRLIVITNLHNPSSVLTTESILREIGKLAHYNGVHVLIDEVYLDAVFEQQQRSSIHLGKQFIVTNSLTKVYGLSGLRCGWILAEPKLIKKMWYLNDLFEVAPPHPSECLSVVAFRHLDRIKKWSKSILDFNHKLANEFLDSRKELQTILPGFGTTIFPRLKQGNVEELYTLLYEKYNTTITPGRFFEMSEHFRIGLGCDSNAFEIGLRNIGKALDHISKK